jgi:uncharacterized protein (TIGR02246 family)
MCIMTNLNQTDTSVDDVAAIRNLFAELAAAWNRADGAAFGALFTDDANYIDVTGTRTCGGAAIGRMHQQLWNTFLKGSMLESSSDADIQFITPDVAIVIVTGAARLAGQPTAPADRQSINTNIVVKQNGTWRIRAFQNNRVQPFDGRPGAPTPSGGRG